MPEPLDYQIVLNLQTALVAISVASGYHYDMPAGAVRLNPDLDVESLIAPDGPRPFIFFKLGDQQWPREQYQPAMRLAHILPVTIAWVQDSDATTDAALLQTFFRGAADVEQAVAGTPASLTRGGLAVDTRITGIRQAGEGAEVWAVVDLEIKTMRTYGQPNG